ncbi:MAG: hypothetical protein AAF660_02925 [Pseudomonadota bacterium]
MTASADFRHPDWGPSSPLTRLDGEQIPGGCPIESPQGRFLFTARPGGGLDIFVNERESIDQPYESGAPLPAPANDAGLADDFCPTPLPDNGLLFVSRRADPDGCGNADIYATVQNPATGWREPVNLGCDPYGPNTPGVEFSPSLIETHFGTFLFFSTDYYTGNQDIYRSRMRSDGTFEPGVRLPWPINTQFDDRQPNVSQDGRRIVFASNRRTANEANPNFDIFYAKKRWLFGRWRRATNLSATVPFDTLDTSETRPSLSWDGKRLVYGSGGVWISELEY